MSKAKETTALHLLAQMEGNSPKCIHPMNTFRIPRTFSADPGGEITLRTVVETPPRDGCDDCDGVFGGGNFIVAPSREEKGGSRSALWNKVKTKAKPVV